MPAPHFASTIPEIAGPSLTRARVDHRRIEGKGVGQVFLVVYHLINQRLPSRNIECIDRTQQNTDREDLPDGIVAVQDKDGQKQRLQQGCRLRGGSTLKRLYLSDTTPPAMDKTKEGN